MREKSYHGKPPSLSRNFGRQPRDQPGPGSFRSPSGDKTLGTRLSLFNWLICIRERCWRAEFARPNTTFNHLWNWRCWSAENITKSQMNVNVSNLKGTFSAAVAVNILDDITDATPATKWAEIKKIGHTFKTFRLNVWETDARLTY